MPCSPGWDTGSLRWSAITAASTDRGRRIRRSPPLRLRAGGLIKAAQAALSESGMASGSAARSAQPALSPGIRWSRRSMSQTSCCTRTSGPDGSDARTEVKDVLLQVLAEQNGTRRPSRPCRRVRLEYGHPPRPADRAGRPGTTGRGAPRHRQSGDPELDPQQARAARPRGAQVHATSQ